MILKCLCLRGSSSLLAKEEKKLVFWRIYKTSAPKAQRWKLNCHVIITQPNYGFQMGAAGRLRT